MHAIEPNPSRLTFVYALVTQPVMAEGLIRILEPADDLQFAGWSQDPEDAVRQVARLQANVLVLDHAFGLRTVAEVLERTRVLTPVTAVLWTKDPSPTDRRLAAEAGIRGVLDKTHSVSVVLACLRSVAEGGSWPIGQPDMSLRSPERIAIRLTQRECEVIALIGEGLKNREIAERMAITPGTVKVHLMHIFEKTGARNRVELSIQAARLLDAVKREGALLDATGGAE
ncbi:MAG: response regulator transcription factor [Bryobacteraceae bacterium]